MPATPKHAIRYPAATDRVADGATAMQNLATDVDGQWTRGHASGNVDANGDLTVAHGLGAVPGCVVITAADANSRVYTLSLVDNTNIKVRPRTSTTGAVLANGTAVDFYWMAWK